MIIKKADMSLDGLTEQMPEEIKKALPYLMIGGGGALLGGLATGGRHKDTNESRMSYAGRLARNMALAGALAGGGALAIHKGVGAINDSVDYEKPYTGGNPELSPVSNVVRGVAFSPLTAAAAGGGALYAVRPDAKGEAAKDAAKLLFPGGKKGVDSVPLHAMNDLTDNHWSADGRKALADKVRDVITHTDPTTGATSIKPGVVSQLQSAGVATRGAQLKPDASKLEKILARLETHYRPTVGKVLGQRLPHAAGRGAVALGAAAIPTLLGALFTDPVDQ